LSSIPRSATIAARSLADLIRSIPAFVTCISTLLPAECVERGVLQTCDFRFQKPQIHERGAAVVVTRRFVDAGAGDREDRDAASVRAAYLDPPQLAATHEPEGPEEEVVRLKHLALPVDYGRRGGLACIRIEVGQSLL
jgi:hypothetical protein